MLWLPNLEETLVQVYDDDDLHEGQRSSEVKCGKRCTLVTKLGQKESLMQVYDGDDLHGGQRSNVVNFALWLPNLVNRIANASFK